MIARNRRMPLAAVLAVPALALAACGGSTVDTAELEETPAESTGTSSSETPTRTAGGADKAVIDDGATQVSEVPDNQMPLTEADVDYLDALEKAGIAVEGTEDQLIAAGHAHCGPDEVLVDAAAGQMVTQGRVKLTAGEVSRVIGDAADDAYC